ncbi:hypothetical protein NP493_123g05059 [Ridgeia piscesae]|uniref:Uncharacterized protein n=1 Tax=Ridgeia piscesae TaxID=27915 RepID=A0AAD9UGQ4_RIDPI|nr:hypothetical protein NP493_123g05059 [Ridgeia piscesae]
MVVFFRPVYADSVWLIHGGGLGTTGVALRHPQLSVFITRPSCSGRVAPTRIVLLLRVVTRSLDSVRPSVRSGGRTDEIRSRAHTSDCRS